MFKLWRRKNRKPNNYKALIIDLQQGGVEKIRTHLAFIDSIKYSEGVDFMLAKMRRPEGDTRSLTLFQTTPKGEFELAIFNVPWNPGVPYLPLILNRDTSKIYGIMLPFNELHDILSTRQKNEIGKLAMAWIPFAFDFKI